MSVASSGYDGTVNEAQWAALADLVGTAYAVASSGDLACTIGGTGDRAVTVAGGTAFGHGVKDVFTGATNLNATSVSSGTRWDTVCVRRDWSAGTGTGTTLVIVPGTSSKAITKGHSTPGVTDDQPIALILLTSGSAAVTLLESLTPTGGKSLYVPTILGVSAGYTAPPGALWYVAATGHQVMSGPSGVIDLDNPNITAFPLAGAAGDLIPWDAPPYYGKTRGWVNLFGSVKRKASGGPLINGGADVQLGTLPSGFKPARTCGFSVMSYGAAQPVRCFVTADGKVTLGQDGLVVQGVALDNVRFYADGN